MADVAAASFLAGPPRAEATSSATYAQRFSDLGTCTRCRGQSSNRYHRCFNGGAMDICALCVRAYVIECVQSGSAHKRFFFFYHLL